MSHVVHVISDGSRDVAPYEPGLFKFVVMVFDSHIRLADSSSLPKTSGICQEQLYKMKPPLSIFFKTTCGFYVIKLRTGITFEIFVISGS